MSSVGPPTDVNPACAACKHQRRKCSESCPLAPFFPSITHTQKFQNVHKLFGVGNVLKILKSINQDFWPMAMETIQFQADARRTDPVHGCLGIIHQLNTQIQACRQELAKTNQQLSYYRQREQNLMLQHRQMRNVPVSSSLPILPLTAYNNQSQNLILLDSANKNHNIGQRKMITYSQPLQESVKVKSSAQMTQAVIEIKEDQESSGESAAGEKPQTKLKNVAGASNLTDSKRRGKQCVEN